MATSKSGPSALELQRMLGISNYQSVWIMQFRLRQPMGAGAKERLGGTVEVDETFFGGSRSGIRGRGALGKVMVAVDVEHADTGGLGRTRMQVIPNAKTSTLAFFSCVHDRAWRDGSHRRVQALPHRHQRICARVAPCAGLGDSRP